MTAIVALDSDELEDVALVRAPEFARSMRDANADLRAGRARPTTEVFAELDRD
ncbi:MAG: hypothetical protein IVW53_10015 [Chloroflexi bacterium]|nr:hypothetical protein [Chloroflexota bacterium]